MKPIDVKDNTYIDTDIEKEINDRNAKVKVGDHEFLNTKILLLKDIHQICRKKFL